MKTNIGHTEAAAGIAGLIKAVLMLRHQAVPASLHFKTLNPHIDLGGVPIGCRPASTGGRAGCVGVSSFGFCGTNAHVVLERGARRRPPPIRGRPHLLTAVGPRPAGAGAAAAARWLDALLHPLPTSPALARTAAAPRAAASRLAVVAADAAARRAALAAAARGCAPAGRAARFLLHRAGLDLCRHGGRADAERSPVFRAVLERCDAVMGLDRPLAELFDDGAALARTDYAQPALYALSAGLGGAVAVVGDRAGGGAGPQRRRVCGGACWPAC